MTPPPVHTATVAGLGLIGGSLARDLAALGVRVLGWDRDPSATAAALAEGVLAAPLGADLAGLEEADALVLAVPVAAAGEVLRRALPRLSRARLVTDAGSTKRGIEAAALSLGLGERFVGAHPLAGHHTSGWAASREGLFAGAPVFLCPAPGATADAVALAQALWRGVGGDVRATTAEAHDRLLAWTSHLPQGVSSSLGRALARAGVSRAQLGPGGRDVTRLAASSPEMWSAIALENADHLGPALAAAEEALRELRQAVEARDAERLSALLREAKGWADAGG